MANKTYEYLGKTDLLYILQLLSNELAKYVKAVEGKDLSTNDLTDELLAEIEKVKDKIEATDDVDFTGAITVVDPATDSNNGTVANTKWVKTKIDDAIGKITGLKFESYDSFEDLPETGEAGVIYLVPNGGSSPNVKDEYFWNASTSSYEKFGTTEMDLSDYVKKEDIGELPESEVKATWEAVFGTITTD